MLDALAQAPVFIRAPKPRFTAQDLEDLEYLEEFGDERPERRKVKGTWAGR
jgi:hypothetical protein